MLVAGIMSGTSADAIDVALVKITGRGWKTHHRLVAFHSMKYTARVRERILTIAAGKAVPSGEISQLNFLLGELFAKACIAACHHAKIPPRRLQLIGSHGQTIYHQGRAEMFAGIPVCATFQIGEPAVIAERTGVTTVADFRPADIAAGGQGAPLVPFFDYLTYRHPRKGRLALNIGGIANLTAIPAGGSPEDVIAFDTGPGNMLIDALAVKLTGGRQSFDTGGKLASSGNISTQLLGRLMRQQYFHRPPPKTAGREQFGIVRKATLTPRRRLFTTRTARRAGHRDRAHGGKHCACREGFCFAKVSSSGMHRLGRGSAESVSDVSTSRSIERSRRNSCSPFHRGWRAGSGQRGHRFCGAGLLHLSPGDRQPPLSDWREAPGDFGKGCLCRAVRKADSSLCSE